MAMEKNMDGNSTASQSQNPIALEIHNVIQQNFQQIQSASKHCRHTMFYTMLCMHVFIFGTGLAMLVTGLYACWGTPTPVGYLLLLAGLAEMVYFLVAKPLNTLHQSLSDMVQTQVAVGGWLQEMSTWQSEIPNATLENKQAIIQSMRDSTKWTLMLMEDYCGCQEMLPTGLIETKKDNFWEKAKEKCIAFLASKNISHTSPSLTLDNAKNSCPAQTQTVSSSSMPQSTTNTQATSLTSTTNTQATSLTSTTNTQAASLASISTQTTSATTP